MQSNLFDDLKSLKAKMNHDEHENKEKLIEDQKKEKEKKLHEQFEKFMQKSGIKKLR